MRQAITTLVALLCLSAAGGAQTSRPAQAPSATFKADVNLVEVHAVVTDQRGEFVAGLTKDDFEIFESGKPQVPTVFHVIDAPLADQRAPASVPAVEPDVRATATRFDGRLYVMVLDDLHTSALRSQLVRRAATQFIERHLRDGDLAAVVHTSGRSDAAQELTPSRRLLLAAVAKFQGQKLPSITSERLAVHLNERDMERAAASSSGETATTPETTRPDDPRDAERGMNAQRALGAIRNVAQWMSDVPGRRKALVLFSEGVEYDIYDVFNNRAASSIMADAREAIAAAQRSNVTIYAVDPRGLTQLADEAITIASLSDDPRVDYGTPRGFGNELLMAQESLISLAQETGGFAVVRNNDIAGGLSRIERDNSRYYVLGYVADPSAAPGRFRKIEVKVRKPGLTVRARRGYVPADLKSAARRESGARPGTPPAVSAALNSAVPVSDVPMRVWAAPFKGTGDKASVALAIEIAGSALKYEQRDGRYFENVDVSIVAADQDGKIRGSDRQTLNLKLKPETHASMTARGGVRLLSRIAVPPARYQLRIGVHESTGGALGTLPIDLEVPDFNKSPFAMSGLVVTSSGAGEFVTMKPDPVLKSVLALPPVATRSFSVQDTLNVFAEVYDRSTPMPHDVEFALAIRPANGGAAVLTRSETRPVAASGSARNVGYTVEVPLKQLAAGEYVLRLEASHAGTGSKASRELPFSVRATQPSTN